MKFLAKKKTETGVSTPTPSTIKTTGVPSNRVRTPSSSSTLDYSSYHDALRQFHATTTSSTTDTYVPPMVSAEDNFKNYKSVVNHMKTVTSSPMRRRSLDANYVPPTDCNNNPTNQQQICFQNSNNLSRALSASSSSEDEDSYSSSQISSFTPKEDNNDDKTTTPTKSQIKNIKATNTTDSYPNPMKPLSSPITPIVFHGDVLKTTQEPEMPDLTYEENYGDLYNIGHPIKYLYPNGYSNMRPRSIPWKISILICISFTYLTVFIVGHCSDRFDLENYQNYNGEQGGDYYDDDELKIVTKWCGSRPLYFMWVLSVLITAISCAYCGIIGYIKARDFVVANGRSQPPGMVGKSDYYVKIDEHVNIHSHCSSSSKFPKKKKTSGGSVSGEEDTEYDDEESQSHLQYQRNDQVVYRRSIYQVDGTPRFLGSHIYRPTQAAVHLTSR